MNYSKFGECTIDVPGDHGGVTDVGGEPPASRSGCACGAR